MHRGVGEWVYLVSQIVIPALTFFLLQALQLQQMLTHRGTEGRPNAGVGCCGAAGPPTTHLP